MRSKGAGGESDGGRPNAPWRSSGRRRSVCIAVLVVGTLIGSAFGSPAQEMIMDHYPLWSPDGAWILFGSNRAGGDEEIFVVSIEGRQLVRVTDNDVRDVNLGWTPDGRVLYQSEVDGAWSRFSARPDGGDVRPEPGAAADAAPLHPSGARLVAQTTGQDRGFLLQVPGRDPVPLSPGRSASQPSFSPDGRWVVWEERDDEMTPISESRLMLLRTDGSERRVLVEAATDPSWSPDGRLVLFKRWDSAERGWVVSVVEAGGRSSLALARGVLPAWSPDGSRIAYMNEYGPHAFIWLVRPDGTDRVCLTCELTR